MVRISSSTRGITSSRTLSTLQYPTRLAVPRIRPQIPASSRRFMYPAHQHAARHRPRIQTGHSYPAVRSSRMSCGRSLCAWRRHLRCPRYSGVFQAADRGAHEHRSTNTHRNDWARSVARGAPRVNRFFSFFFMHRTLCFIPSIGK